MSNKPQRAYCGSLFLSPSDYGLDDDSLEDSLSLHLGWLEDFVSDEPLRLHTRYAIAQIEQCPASQRLHAQWYAQLQKPMRGTGFLAAVPIFAGSHFEECRGTAEQNRAYCSKEDSKVFGPVEVGQLCEQGKRTDLDRFTAMVMEGASNAEIARAFPKTYLLHGGKVATLRAAIQTRPRDTAFQPRQWQQDLIDRIKMPADDRSIIWVLDSQGGRGKSRLAYHMYCEYGAQVLEGKVADMAFMVEEDTKVVIFDVSRAAAEHSEHLYSMAEKIKNKMVISTKYASCQKVFTHNVHVIFFANMHPKEGMWSQDRVTLINLDI